MTEYKESREDQEVMELVYRLLHNFDWTSNIQTKNEFYYTLQENVRKWRQDGEFS